MSALARTTLAIALLASATAAHAADGWFFRTGAITVDPKSDNGTLAGTLPLQVGSDTQLSLIVGRQLSDHWSVELLAATPFTHMAKLAGSNAVEFKHLPPTLSLQYAFAPGSKVNPFIGAGLNYTIVFDEKERGPVAGTNVSLDNSMGLAAQAGIIFKINENWDVVADARWIDIDADARLNGASIGTANVDPLTYSVALGYNF